MPAVAFFYFCLITSEFLCLQHETRCSERIQFKLMKSAFHVRLKFKLGYLLLTPCETISCSRIIPQSEKWLEVTM